MFLEDGAKLETKTIMLFGAYVKNKRKHCGISQRQFAMQIGITPSYMSKIERGEFSPPSEEVIKNMADILCVDSDELLAKANKVSSDILRIIKSDPKRYAKMIRTTT